MKIKFYRFLIVISLLFVFYVVPAFASDSTYTSATNFSSMTNIACLDIKYKYTSSTVEDLWYYGSSSPISVTLVSTGTNNAYQYKVSSSSTLYAYQVHYTNGVLSGSAPTSFTSCNATSVSPSCGGNSDISSYVFYSVQGTNSYNGSTMDGDPNAPVTSDTDILNFNWQGDGIKVYNLHKGDNVSGYADNQLRWFDIECYGQFTYTGSDTLFPMFQYKKMQTQILTSSVLTFGSMTRMAGEGFGVKQDSPFQWVSDTNSLKNGQVVKFRVVYQAPLLEKGTYDIKVGTTVPNGSSSGSYLVATVKGLNFLNENAGIGTAMDTSGSTADVSGSTPGNMTTAQANSSNPDTTSGQSALDVLGMVGSSVINFFKSVTSLTTDLSGIMPSITAMFSAMFSFLPSPLPQLITTALGIMIFVSVLKFLRG